MHSELSLIEQVKSGKLWDIPGGIHPPERKSLSNTAPIDLAPLSPCYYVPIKQHIGNEGALLVNVGDLVLAGQPLTNAIEGLSLPVHAPTSGVVKEIIPHVSAHPSGKPEITVVIESDNKDTAIKSKPIKDWHKAEISALTTHLQSMGVAGLGGAAFPTYVKSNPHKDIKLLIINGVECEPYITADDVLMRSFAADIIQGINILQHMVQPELVVIAIEDNKPEAVEAIKLAVTDQENIDVKVIPTKYPSGGEKQLIEIITGQQVPSNSIPADIGIVMQNIGTCFAIKEAVIDGKALISRVVTVTGESISRPQNLWVRLGAPISDLLSHCGLVAEEDQRLIMGGPMMGFNIMDIMMPVVKSTNCILAPSEYNLPSFGVEQACIRCSLCADACPVNLLPQQMLWYSKAKDHEKLEEYNLADCIECGVCAYVCPSQIPLVQYYRSSKVEIKQEKEDKIKSDKAKERFETRQLRLERDKQARLLKHKESADKRKKALESDGGAKDKIAAALARAKAKKASAGESEAVSSDVKTTDTQDKVAAAIARAKAKKQAQAQAESKSEVTPATVTTANTEPKDNIVETTETVEAKSAEQIKKDKIAATVARAKAKKLAQAAESEAVTTEPSQTKSAETVEDKSAEQIKKDKIAATIAKAKAKKLTQDKDQSEQK
ncbi:electron transport complex subunit C [Psychrosphaera saromensis]|uniref:electron transport complex subunit RsxC n=1 Tax=Psychrosphaera saromensis TaxID=716813 RepID=UPI0019935CBA|nr:electron transport complex subunit RsxC [Psychrosphaera saromensis]GHB62786.1 electron transport complex subunit C [Psychrosphaera saromensis]GLQ15489.1 electron transport complex subunit C [Psychrosphaera saromensis]